MSTEQTERIHDVAPDGRERHFFEKVDGVWACECGEVRDKNGRQHVVGRVVET